MKARGIQENRQQYLDDYYDEWEDWYDDYWHYDMHYYPSYVFVGMPCTHTVVQVGNVTYYQCGSVWYSQVYVKNEVQYVEISAPKGAEITSLSNPKTIEVNGKTYYISEHTFYEKIKRDGKDIYVVVDPPYGVEVDSIPEKSVEVKVE